MGSWVTRVTVTGFLLGSFQFVMPSVLDLGSGTGQTEGQTNGQTDDGH